MKFTKMHGLGNDYIYVNCFTEVVKNPEQMAKQLSCQHTGIGADGLILIQPSKYGEVRMCMFNADGSIGEMCGNGIRCVAKYAYERGLTNKKQFSIETGAGMREVTLEVKQNQVEQIRVDMGKPIINAADIPIKTKNKTVINQAIYIQGEARFVTGVSMGNPHVVTYVKEVGGLDIATIGPLIERYESFSNRTNVEFAEVVDTNTIKVRVWERGTGETMACGTGACAVLVASVLNHLTDHQVWVKLLGGDLFVEWSKKNGHIYIEGPAVSVFDGEIHIE